MSVLSNMKNGRVLVLNTTSTLSGAKKQQWIDDRDIKINIHKVREYYNEKGYKHIEATHIGLTFDKNLSKYNNRLQIGDVTYEILECDINYRLTHLTLKEHIYDEQ